MKKVVIAILFALCSLALVSVAGSATAGRANDRPRGVEPIAQPDGGIAAAGEGESCTGPNLLQNPSFEGQYSAYVPPEGHPDCPAGICTTAQMAPDWTPWWRSHDPADPKYIIRMPEYKPADPIFTDPVRVRTGSAAQQYFTFYSTHEAGFYQQVTTTPGDLYYFTLWGHSWSAQDDGDAYSGPEDGALEQKIGIDPTGGTDWQSANVVWGTPRIQYDYYGLFEVEGVAQGSTITVFTYSQPAYAVKHNDVYWDDATLTGGPNVPLQMSIEPSGGLFFVADVDIPATTSQTAVIELPLGHGFTWSAVLEPGGTLTPVLSANSGAAGENLVVTVNSGGYGLGTYEATITFTACDPRIAGSPATLPVTLIVVPEVQKTYLPLARR